MNTWNDAQLSRTALRERKRDALVRQAALEFRRRGYHATSMDDIAAALGVTKGALYRYVKSKDEVLFECFAYSNRIGSEALDVAEAVQGTAVDKLRAFIVSFVGNYLENNLAGGAMVEIGALLPAQREEIVRGRDAIERRLRRIIETGMAEGTLATGNVKLMIFSFMGAINWIPSWFSPEKGLSIAEIADQLADIALRGLEAR